MQVTKTTRIYFCLLILPLLYNNTAFAQFSDKKIIATCEICDPTKILSIDLNGDGNLDILLQDRGIFWYANNEHCEFSRATTISAHTNIEIQTVCDIDKDGDMDILSTLPNNTILLYKNNRDSQFFEQIILESPFHIKTRFSLIESLHMADMDGNGYKDIILSSKYGRGIFWYANEGDGKFEPEPNVVVADRLTDNRIYIEDIDMDGYIDVISTYDNFPDYQIEIKDTDADGIIDRRRKREFIDNHINVADIDGQVGKDIISISISNSGRSEIIWYRNDGSDRPFERIVTNKTLSFDIEKIHVFDVNGNGHIDVLFDTRRDGIFWLANNGPISLNSGKDQFSEPVQITPDYHTIEKVEDIDGDGDLDIFVQSDGEIIWLKNKEGRFNNTEVTTQVKMVTKVINPTSIEKDRNKSIKASKIVGWN